VEAVKMTEGWSMRF